MYSTIFNSSWLYLTISIITLLAVTNPTGRMSSVFDDDSFWISNPIRSELISFIHLADSSITPITRPEAGEEVTILIDLIVLGVVGEVNEVVVQAVPFQYKTISPLAGTEITGAVPGEVLSEYVILKVHVAGNEWFFSNLAIILFAKAYLFPVTGLDACLYVIVIFAAASFGVTQYL